MLTIVDHIVIYGYLAVVIAIGIWFSQKIKSIEDYFLAGRGLLLPLAIATMAATWYGAAGTIAAAEYGFLFGLSVWFVWCIPAHLSRIPLALWVAPKMRLTTGITLPDLIERLYSKRLALIAAILMLFYCTQIGEVTALGIIGSTVWGIPIKTAAIILVALVVLYTMLGGLMSVVLTDLIQFVFMMFGLFIITPLAWHSLGGWEYLTSNLEPIMFTPLGDMPASTIIVLVVLGLSLYPDPSFYQRFQAAKSDKIARRSLLICLLVWITIDVILAVVGMMARVKYPEMVPGSAYVQFCMDYAPPVIRGLFIVGLLGSIMSTLDSYYLTAGMTLVKDIYGRLTKREVTEKKIVALTRVGVVIAAAVGAVIALQFELVMEGWILLGSLFIAGAFVPVICGIFWPWKRTVAGGWASMLFGLGVALIWQLLGSPFELDPLIVAFPASFVAFLIGNTFGPALKKDWR
jgi:SSS family solute:Na+ symporter